MALQATLKSKIEFNGVGLHSGEPVKMVLKPAAAGFGIWFNRVDVLDKDAMIPAIYTAFSAKPLCTRLANEDGVDITTVEHIMAALSGCGVRNALIDIDGPEVPIMDGSSAEFVAEILKYGVQKQDAVDCGIEILETVSVTEGMATASLSPSDALEIDFFIDFEDSAIGQQSKHLQMANGTFVRELSDSRTFCRKSDINMMHDAGLALGGTYENAVVVDGSEVVSPGGLRHTDEAVRHKMLDALGDLALAGMPILGRYTGNRSGHALTNALLHKLFASPASYRVVPFSQSQQEMLPGAGVDLSDLVLLPA